jgi:phage-related protein
MAARRSAPSIPAVTTVANTQLPSTTTLSFTRKARDRLLDAPTVVAEGEMPPIAKPLVGFGSDVFELALAFRGDAFRVAFAVQLRPDVWVIHAFRQKSEVPGSKHRSTTRI